jgi:DNA-directed RNA polymerase specialized sigma subunit
MRQKEHALTEAYAGIERRQGCPAEDEEVAAVLGLDLDAFYDWLTPVRGVSVLSLDMPLEPDTQGNTLNYLDTLLVDAAPGPLQIVETQDLKMHKAILHLRAALQSLKQGQYAIVG